MDKKVSTSLVKNDMIHINILEGDAKAILVLQREAVNKEDVLLCTSAFETLFAKITQVGNKWKLRVKTQAVKVHVLNIKQSVVNAIQNFFQQHAVEYAEKLDRCAIEVSSEPLAVVIQGVVKIACPSCAKQVLVTSTESQAQNFLMN
jgi:hypothetical protein